MLGRSALNTSKTSSSILNTIANDVHKEINDVVADIAKDLNIHDFYSAHILDYCEVSSLVWRFINMLQWIGLINSHVGLLQTITSIERHIPSLQKHDTLLESYSSFPFRPYGYPRKGAQTWRKTHRSQMAVCNQTRYQRRGTRQ